MQRLIITCLFIILTMLPMRMAYAELKLENWKSYGAMAEQGGVCAAFARLMELQSLVDEKLGKLWLERRKFAGSTIRQASILEGLPPAKQEDIDRLVNSYASWLISNLNSHSNDQILDNAAHVAATKMINEVCYGLYERADSAIMQSHPELARCPATPVTEPKTCIPALTPPLSQTKIADVNNNSQELKRARDEITMLTAQNESLRKKLHKLRAALLEREMMDPEAGDEDTLKDPFVSASPSLGHTDNMQPVPIKNNIMDNNIGPDSDTFMPSANHSKTVKREKLKTIETTIDVQSSDMPEQDTDSDNMSISARASVKTKLTRNPNISNRFVAQLGSYASSEQANDGIKYLKTTFNDTFKVLELSVVPKTLRSGQRVYDLVTGQSDRNKIEDICTALWEHRFGCFVTAVN